MENGNSIADYDDKGVAAARAAIVELMGILGEYREEIVLVGGWVPSLLLPEPEDPTDRHPGSLDVDLALDHRKLTEAGYETIEKLLIQAGYQRSTKQPFQYFREVHGVLVRVDLLAGEYGGTGKGHRTQKVQDVRPRKAHGCDLVFQIAPVTVPLEGQLPSGARDTVRVPLASVVPFLTMKAIVMSERRKSKDPFDIWYVLRHFPGGVDAVTASFRPYLTNRLVQEGLRSLAEKFASLDHIGPLEAAAFDADLTAEARAIRQRQAFELVQAFLERLGFSKG
jgi:hypothetical protein